MVVNICGKGVKWKGRKEVCIVIAVFHGVVVVVVVVVMVVVVVVVEGNDYKINKIVWFGVAMVVWCGVAMVVWCGYSGLVWWKRYSVVMEVCLC